MERIELIKDQQYVFACDVMRYAAKYRTSGVNRYLFYDSFGNPRVFDAAALSKHFPGVIL